MRKFLITTLALIGLVAGIWLFKSPDDTVGKNMPQMDIAKAEAVVAGSNQFGVDLLSQLTGKDNENEVFSPYSISTALSMVYEGAVRQTAQQIESVLNLPESDKQRRESVLATYQSLQSDSEYELSVANGSWTEQTFRIKDQFMSTIQDYYRSQVASADFVTRSNRERKRINSWVADKTEEKITDLFPKSAIDKNTKLVLANAVYFNGQWEVGFDESNTFEADFYIGESSTTTVDMMSRTDEAAEFGFMQNDTLKMLRMPYRGGDLSAVFVLPKQEDGISDLVDNLNAESLRSWKEQLQSQQVNTYIPKFTLETEYDLSSILKQMDITNVFDKNSANLSGIAGKNVDSSPVISAMKHKVFVKVDETGTEAAAATGVSGNAVTTSVNNQPDTEFRADHPFIFVIQDDRTDNIIFMGKVINPNA